MRRWPALLPLLLLPLACADELPMVKAGAEGSPCAESFECDPGLFCLAELCQAPRGGNNGADPDLGPLPSADQGTDADQAPDASDLGSPDLADADPDTPEPDAGEPDAGEPDAQEPDMGAPVCLEGQDQDGDGILDQVEGSEDTDGDGLPDCLDRDSDNDGLYDDEEVELYASDPYRRDSDNDGAWDLLEVAAGSALDRADSLPSPHGQVVVIPAGENSVRVNLSFSSQVLRGDVYFLMDTSTTMDGEIANLKRTLTQSLIPGLRDALPDVSFGVGHFDDFAQSPYGNNPDFRAYEHLLDITSDTERVRQAIDGLQTCCADGDGRTFPESHVVALWGTATNQGLGNWFSPRQEECGGKGGLGHPCFRTDALPIIVLVTDASYHNGPGGANAYSGISPAPPTFQQAALALNELGAKVISIVSDGGDDDALPHAREMARRTGAVNASQQPLVYSTDAQGNGLGNQILEAFNELTGNVRRRVTAQGADPDEEDNDDVARFIVGAEPLGATPSDGTQGIQGDAFLGVLPGTELQFRVTVTRDDQQAEGPQGQHRFARVAVRALGDDAVLLDEQILYLVFAREGATIDPAP